MHPTWRQLVLRHARGAGLDLPAETVDELAIHLEDLYSASQRDGVSDADARLRAMRALEDAAFPVLTAHAARANRQPRMRDANDLSLIAQDRRSLTMFYALRMAFRQFRQHRAFAVTTVLVLGLGTGAAAAVYSIVDAVVLRPLPYAQPDRLVAIWETNAPKGLAHEGLSPVNFMDYRALPAFEDAAAWWRPRVDLVDPGLDPVRVDAVEASGNLFSVIGAHPALGPGFPEPSTMYEKNNEIAVISDRLWRTRYSADPSLIGKQLRFSGRPYTIVGIMPPGFGYPGDVDVWERLEWDMSQHSRAAHFMEAVARLKPGVDIAQAQVQLDALTRRLGAENPSTNNQWGARPIALLEDQLGYYRPALIVLFGAAGLLLTIGCLNVASLLLTRALSRDREMAVRTALGASPRQLVTQLLAEGLVLSLCGAVIGVGAARLALPLIVHTVPLHIPRLDEIAINARVLGFGIAVVIATTMFFGMVPSLAVLRRHLSANLKSGDRGSSHGGRRIYHVLVIGELALACALLVSSALLVRTVRHMTEASTGVSAETVVTANIQLSGTAYAKWPAVTTTFEGLLDRVRQEPGVLAAGAGNFLPLEVGWRLPFQIDGATPPARPEDAPQAQHSSVSTGFFEAMGVRVLNGRLFMSTDTAASAGVVVVNQTFASRYLSGGAMGTTLHTSAKYIGPLGENLLAGQAFEIVGVVDDMRDVPIGQPIEPAIYFDTQQFPFHMLSLTIKGRDIESGVSALRAALKEVAPNVPIAGVSAWPERMRAVSAQPRLLMSVLMFFSGLAALLAAVGVYGLFSWSVAVRRRELAIRLTLGAKPAGIGMLVMRQSAMLVAIGLVAGWIVIRLSERAIAKVLFDMGTSDVISTATASAILLIAALVACSIPALRAARTDPAEALRD